MEILKAFNLGFRFLLEILVLIILGYWGFQFVPGSIFKIVLGVGVPLIVAVIWGIFGAPKSTHALSGFPFLLLEIVIFGLPVVALLLLGKLSWAFTYGIVTTINITLMKIWNQ